MTRMREPVRHGALTWLLITVAVVIAPHTLHLPLWLTAAVLACGGLRYVLSVRGEQLPGRVTRLLAVVAATGAIYASHGTIVGLDAGVALLSLMAGFKLLELRDQRDGLVLLLLGYFLLGTHFLYDQTLLTAAHMLLATWLLTTLLIATQGAEDGTRPMAHARLSATMLVQSLPIMVILFAAFPRIAGPLWGMPEDAYAGMTGLSEEMTPGSISDLSRSNEVAFRVEFAEDPPPRPSRYWRGPVMESYDGRTWSQGARRDDHPTNILALGEPTDYTVTLEPHNQPWLLTLDVATAVDHAARFDRAHQLTRGEPLRQRVRYQAQSTLDYRLGDSLEAGDRDRFTRLPDGMHPQATQLAEKWRASTPDDRDVVDRGLAHFRSEPFSYTLQPPRLEGDSIDQFLFEARAGFCEHYAAAFTVLMRAADIPARVVTGYLGGSMNPAGDYMIVRQSDAHAWVEVWLDRAGWQRVDPTAQVSPDRVAYGLADALSDNEPRPGSAMMDGGFSGRLGLRWDAFNTYWNRWVLAYGPTLQDELMERLNLASWQRVAAALTGAMILILIATAALVLYRGRPRPADPVAAEWQRFCRRLSHRGLAPGNGEGPRDFGERAMAHWPRHANTIEEIVNRYLAIRYGRDNTIAALDSLRTAIRRLRL